MRDSRCWREMFIRGGITAVMAAIAYFILGADPWVFALPVAICALVCLKWALRPRDDQEGSDDP